MFRKLVANLSFSPALVGQLGFYAKRLRREEATRRIGLVFTALALVVQSFAVFSPPESANAANADSIIYQSLNNKAELLRVYDAGRDSAGHTDIQQIYKHFGVTRQDIVNSKEEMVYTNSQGGKIKFTGRTNYGVSSRWAVNIPGTNSTIYTGAWQDKPYKVKAVVGNRAVDGKWFAIMLYCGNVLYVDMPPAPVKPLASCTSLTAAPLSRTNYRLSARGSASNGATIKGYIFTIRDKNGTVVAEKKTTTSSTTSTVEHSFTKDGSYTATVTVDTSEGKKSSTACKVAIAVSPAPIAECSSLSVTSLSRTKFTAHAKAATANGATISSYAYTVKNDQDVVVVQKTLASSNQNNSFDYTFAEDGTYTIRVVVDTSLGERTSDDCMTTLTVTPEERCPLNPDLTVSDKDCKPCADDETIWYKDENCAAQFELLKDVQNVTQSLDDANETTANPGDILQYELTIKNTGKDTGEFIAEDDLTDTLEYANLKDLGGGTIRDDATLQQVSRSIVKWDPVTLKPGESSTKIVSVQVKDEIPAMARHESARNSYDCKITNTFGQTVDVHVDCPPEKVVETVVAELPKTGARTNVLAGAITFAVVAFFYARSRQLQKEVRLIRHDLNAGTI